MIWSVMVMPVAEKQLARMSNPDRGRILAAIAALQDGPEGQDIRPMTGRADYRLRVGKWRVLMDMDEENRTIFINRVGPRGDVYK